MTTVAVYASQRTLFLRCYEVHQRLFAAGICALLAAAMYVEHRFGSAILATLLVAFFLQQAWQVRGQLTAG